MNRIEHVHVPPPQFKWGDKIGALSGIGNYILYSFLPKGITGIINIIAVDDCFCRTITTSTTISGKPITHTYNYKAISGFRFIGFCSSYYANGDTTIDGTITAIGCATGTIKKYEGGTEITKEQQNCSGPVKMEVSRESSTNNGKITHTYSVTFTNL